ncbi:hypothetical protein [Streptomyces sp. H27-C3]|uniref:hypothetical protein n=1 Tax=Streptomyces sp. H27-C3 TaxID=3046305 RepID=UPI0024B9EF77|nr:hypothetical protein [Streptomyces sp. H27-C3]MDJ0464992.1 hypothetical protein [Streptomyces sp. H27-C3]
MPRLIATVYVKDPETFQWVTCEAGTEPEPRLAALILTPSAWEGSEAPGPDDDEGEPDPAPDPAPSQEPAAPAEPTPPATPAAPAEVPAEAEKKPRARRPAKPADE